MISFLERIINTIAPGRCAVCGARLTVGERLVCSSCNLRLDRNRFAASPYENEMAQMFWGRFPVEKAAALCSSIIRIQRLQSSS